MSVLYTVKEDSATLWCICRDQTYLATRLGMNEAIRQAGHLARDHHRRTGLAVSVEIASHEGTTRLSRYAKPATPLEAVASGTARLGSAQQELTTAVTLLESVAA